jgi:hypothetical protein
MKTLKLDANYKPIEFISFRKVIKLFVNEKIDVLACWDGESFVEGLDYPATIRLREYARIKPIGVKFSFKAVFRRDAYTCQYTGKKLSGKELTIDHIVPKKLGGKSCWTNCCTASWEINAIKGHKTLEQSGLKLLRKPSVPKDPMFLEFSNLEDTHPDWSQYFQEM